jgi:hypothetical protein
MDETVIEVAKDAMMDGQTMEAILVLTETASLDKAIGVLSVPSVGQVLASSWGYEQTRVTFYQVVGVTKASVKLRKINKSYATLDNSRGYSATVIAVPGTFIGETMTKRIKPSYDGDGYGVKITDNEYASLWNGTPKHESGEH